MSQPEGATQEIDLDQVRREIDEEVRARRAAGDFPPGFERDLDLLFARFAPAAASGDDLEALLAAADRSSFIDVDVPTASNTPGVAPIKKGLRKLQSWYLRYLAQQVSAFAASTVGTLRALATRVEALEAANPGASPAVLDELRHLDPPSRADEDDVVVVEHFAGVAGRVAVVESGHGALVRRLLEAGIDAYGVESRAAAYGVESRAAAYGVESRAAAYGVESRAAAYGVESRAAAYGVESRAAAYGTETGVAPSGPDRSGPAELEIRPDEPIDHLRAVAASALEGLVLVGCTDRFPLGAQLELADLAAEVLADGGRLAVVTTPAEAWGRDDPVLADLSPGRPLRAVTWVHLLERRGFLAVEAREGTRRDAVVAVRRR